MQTQYFLTYEPVFDSLLVIACNVPLGWYVGAKLVSPICPALREYPLNYGFSIKDRLNADLGVIPTGTFFLVLKPPVYPTPVWYLFVSFEVTDEELLGLLDLVFEGDLEAEWKDGDLFL